MIVVLLANIAENETILNFMHKDKREDMDFLEGGYLNGK